MAMNDFKYPNFILGIISLILLIVGVAFLANGFAGGDYILGASVLLGGIHWIWSIIDVLKDYNTHTTKENRNILWIILVIIIPPVGGLLYYAFGRRVAM
jgi:hypothetical protein